MQLVPYGGRDVPANVSCEEVTLDSGLRPGKSTVLEAYSALAHQLKPRPREILQTENQLVLLTAAQHTISPYPISSETTEAGRLSPEALLANLLFNSAVEISVHELLLCTRLLQEVNILLEMQSVSCT